MLTVATQATDRGLLTIPELRAAAGVADNSRDTELTVLGNRVAAAIAHVCNVARDGAVPPTLRLETVSEQFRFAEGLKPDRLVLSRRPVVSITSVVEDSVEVEAEDYELDAAGALLLRLCDDSPSSWGCKVVVAYQAGWDEVPHDLRLAAAKLATSFWTEAGRDPSLKRVEVEGIGSKEFWVSPKDDPLVSGEILDLLAPYVNASIG